MARATTQRLSTMTDATRGGAIIRSWAIFFDPATNQWLNRIAEDVTLDLAGPNVGYAIDFLRDAEEASVYTRLEYELSSCISDECDDAGRLILVTYVAVDAATAAYLDARISEATTVDVPW